MAFDNEQSDEQKIGSRTKRGLEISISHRDTTTPNREIGKGNKFVKRDNRQLDKWKIGMRTHRG